MYLSLLIQSRPSNPVCSVFVPADPVDTLQPSLYSVFVPADPVEALQLSLYSVFVPADPVEPLLDGCVQVFLQSVHDKQDRGGGAPSVHVVYN